jgi:hypothetical protein
MSLMMRMYNPANGFKSEQVLPDVDEGAGVECSVAGPGGSILRSMSSPNDKCQRPEGKLGAERELHVESSRCHGRQILEVGSGET